MVPTFMGLLELRSKDQLTFFAGISRTDWVHRLPHLLSSSAALELFGEILQWVKKPCQPIIIT